MLDTRKKILVVDDEASIRDSLRLLLSSTFEVSTAPDGAEALTMIEGLKPDIILLDVAMPVLDGLETLKQLRGRSVPTPVIMLTATTTVQTAVKAMKNGAVDYVSKPFDVDELTSLIVNTLDCEPGLPAVSGEEEREGRPPRAPLPEADFGALVGRAPPMVKLFERVSQVAAHQATVLITGESGTGKELIARRIHELSGRAKGPFVAINCAAIPESLIESELFGHEKGAFTHAIDRRLGHCELADGGTLFLDEIGELGLGVQVKMLRFLQEQEFYRVGRSKPTRVDVRIVCATNRDLEAMIAEKRFRQDLFYRINVIHLDIPSLRDRFEDVEPLVQHFVKKFGPTYRNRVLTFSADALKALREYEWPGNVRELENIIESLMALSASDEVQLDDLPKKLVGRRGGALQTTAPVSELDLDAAERKFESEMILKALRKTDYVQTRAAKLLGVSRRILKYKMDKLGIADSPDGALAPKIEDPAVEEAILASDEPSTADPT